MNNAPILELDDKIKYAKNYMLRDLENFSEGKDSVPLYTLGDLRKTIRKINPKLENDSVIKAQVEIVKDNLRSQILGGKIPFPWKRFWMNQLPLNSNQTTPQLFMERLREYKPTVEHYELKGEFKEARKLPQNLLLTNAAEAEYYQVISMEEERDNINVLVDYFQEPARMLSSVGKNPIALLTFYQNATQGFSHFVEQLPFPKEESNKPVQTKSEIPRLTINDIKDTINIPDSIVIMDNKKLRDAFYIGRGYHSEPSHFRAVLSRYVYMLFNAKKILDFSSGWGDRLLGALSLEEVIEYYHGFDPNEYLFPGYQAMIDECLLDPKNKTKYKMKNLPFEDAILSEKTYDSEGAIRTETTYDYDLVFTSPPYFDQENYGSGKGSSNQEYPTLGDWLNKFMFVALKKAIDHLVPGGILALNMDNSVKLLTSGNLFVEPTLNFLATQRVVYKGMIMFGKHIPDNNSDQPSAKRARMSENTGQEYSPRRRSFRPIFVYEKY